jgi:hypothetical protein
LKSPVLLFAVCALGVASAQSPAPVSPTPAKNWVLHLFTDKEGFRSMSLRGSSVQPVSADQINVTDLSITVYSGDAAARVDSILLSPQASFFYKANHAAGDKSVRLLRDDVEVAGEGWTYDDTTKKVTLAKNVRVVFHAQLKDILK